MKKKSTSAKKKISAVTRPLVAIIMGSKTDYKTMQKAEEALTEFDIPFITQVVSAHRTPEAMVEFAKMAHTKGIKVIIAGAGAAAHLPGMVASLTPLPVIGVPVIVNSLNGLDALLAIAQMPRGVPVATMAIDNAYNAGLFAARILSTDSQKILRKTLQFQKAQVGKVKKMNQELKKLRS
ncbi:MAG: 5-(carboxyamino)imidazole ribonucleotide mutase [Bdellovibrionaceae bacterium]|nr:5-(carboxyamino)imidazole ribonucleotide mutase [Bdellovibrio sp.]